MTCCPNCGHELRVRLAGMTRMQSKLVTFVNRFTAEHGYSPSYDEIKDHLNLVSKAGVNRLVCELQQRGHITHLPGQARSIRVVAA